MQSSSPTTYPQPPQILLFNWLPKKYGIIWEFFPNAKNIDINIDNNIDINIDIDIDIDINFFRFSEKNQIFRTFLDFLENFQIFEIFLENFQIFRKFSDSRQHCIEVAHGGN